MIASMLPGEKKEGSLSCKISKNLYCDYFKKQRSKGNNATCKTCLEERKKEPTERVCLEHVCSACNISKSIGSFTKVPGGKGVQ